MFVLVGSRTHWKQIQEQIVSHGACAVPITGPVPGQFESIHLLFSNEGTVFAQADGQVAQVLQGTQLVVLFDAETRDRLSLVQPASEGNLDQTEPPRVLWQTQPGANDQTRPITRPSPAVVASRPITQPSPAVAARPITRPSEAVVQRPVTRPTEAVVTRPVTQPTPAVQAPTGSSNYEQATASTSEDDPMAQTVPVGVRVDAAEPIWKRYETMTRAEKIHLAKYGNADERRLILRDRDSSLHAFVLTNPGFGATELAALFRAGSVSGQFVLRVCERRELYQNPTVAEALVFHPQTPIDLAERLVALLPVEVVRRIAKQGQLRSQIVTAARRRVVST